MWIFSKGMTCAFTLIISLKWRHMGITVDQITSYPTFFQHLGLTNKTKTPKLRITGTYGRATSGPHPQPPNTTRPKTHTFTTSITSTPKMLVMRKVMMTSPSENIFPVTGLLCGEFTGPRSFDVFFDLGLNKQLSKQWRRRWFKTPWRSLRRHCNVFPCNSIIIFSKPKTIFPQMWPVSSGIHLPFRPADRLISLVEA